MISKQKSVLLFIASCFCTITIFTYLLSTVSPSEILQVFKDLQVEYLILFVSLSLSGTFLRALRYRTALLPAGHRPELLPLFLITLVRNFTADLLPARLGSTIYIYLAKIHLQIPYAAATSSFTLAFLFDLIALAPLLLIISLSESNLLTDQIVTVCILSSAVLVVSFLFVFFLDKGLEYASRLLSRISFAPGALIAFTQDLQVEMKNAKQANTYSKLFFLSLLIRICKYGSLYIFLIAILAPLGFTIYEVPLFKSLLGILSAEVAASLPISGIAGFGAYEGAWTAAFHLMGFPLDLSKLTAVSHHLFTQFYGYSLGAASLLLLVLPYRRILFFLISPARIVASLLIASTICAGVILVAQTTRPPLEQSNGVRTQAAESSIFPFSQTVIFDSKRDSTFGIYKIKLGKVESLIDSPKWHEIYPDPSPDGSMIAYARVRSLSRHAPAQIWLYHISQKKNEKILEEGTFPTFSRDGESIYFELERSKVMRYDLQTKEISEIFPRENPAFRKHQIVKPRMNNDDTMLSFTSDAPYPWHAWRISLKSGTATKIAQGCEPAWGPQNESVWIKKEGLQSGSGIMLYTPQSKSSKILVDDGAPYGHEYFPSYSNNGRYLLYSAAPPDQHDHLSANYQLFVRDLKERKTLQLTNDFFTNRWPRVLPHPPHPLLSYQ